MRQTLQRFAKLLLAASLFTATAQPISANEDPDGSLRPLRVGCFIERANEADPELVATKLSKWIRSIVPADTYKVSSVIETNPTRWASDVKNSTYDLYSMFAYQFLENEGENLLKPAFMTTGGTRSASTFLLITRSDRAYESIADLEGKSIIVDSGGFGDLPLQWLATEIATACPPPLVSKFAKISVVQSPTHALFPVYFDKADACIITRAAFTEASTTNSNIPFRVKEITNSSPLLVSVFAFRRDFPESLAKEIADKAVASTGSGRSREFLDSILRDGFEAFKPTALASTATLQSKYQFIFQPRSPVAKSGEVEPE